MGWRSVYRQLLTSGLMHADAQAYVILHDKTPHELAMQRPHNQTELLQVPGIGMAKAERYGEALLAAIAASSAEGESFLRQPLQ